MTDRFLGIIAKLKKNKVENQVSAVQVPGVKAMLSPHIFICVFNRSSFGEIKSTMESEAQPRAWPWGGWEGVRSRRGSYCKGGYFRLFQEK